MCRSLPNTVLDEAGFIHSEEKSGSEFLCCHSLWEPAVSQKEERSLLLTFDIHPESVPEDRAAGLAGHWMLYGTKTKMKH